MKQKKTKTELPITKALIYCRVSSAGQRTEGHGLESQEQRCREYAKQKGLEVEEVFLDTVTGNSGYEEREAMSKLLKHLDSNKGTRYAVIFDDIKRLARNVSHHLKLRLELNMRDVLPLSPNFNFEESPEGEFVETIVAATGQLEREQNKRQVRQKTESLIRSGFYSFVTPRGYQRTKDSNGQVCHIRKEPEATTIQEALVGYAEERFKTKADVYRFLIERNFYGGKFKEEYVKKLLENILFTGYFNYEKWGIHMQKLRLEPLISLDAFYTIQERLHGKERTSNRKDIREEYPLRGLVLCNECKKPMTASTTRKKKGYERVYYRCKTKDCDLCDKGIHEDRIHTDFEKLIASFAPKEATLELVTFKFKEEWDKRELRLIEKNKKTGAELKIVNEKIESLLDRVSRKTTSEILISEYEKRLEGLYEEKEKLDSRINNYQQNKNFGTALELVMGFFKSPYEYYKTGDVIDKRLAFDLVFTQQIPFDHNKGFGTVNYSDFVRIFQQIAINTPSGCAYPDLNRN